MISLRAFTIPFLFIFITVILFGMFLTAGHMAHDRGCPLAPGQTMVFCSLAPFEHIRHWQSAFSSLAAEILILVLGVLFLYFFDFFDLFDLYSKQYLRKISEDVPLTGLLFARNVLHPRAP